MGLFTYTPKGRIGYITLRYSGWGIYEGVTGELLVRVEEVKREGKYSHLRALEISGGNPKARRRVERKMIVPTDEVYWVLERDDK